MRVTVRASEVREGDRLIVPDGEHVVVPSGHPHFGRVYAPLFNNIAEVAFLAPGILAHPEQRVVVERPDPPITITVELTPREADAVSALWAAYSKSDPATTQQVMAKVAAAIVAARAGETQ